jgi:tetratricopeptide (TPR) repeat protein
MSTLHRRENGDDLVQKHLNVASSHLAMSEDVKALENYSKAFDVLTEDASDYAHKQPDVVKNVIEDGEKVYRVLPKLLEETKSYLQRDNTAYIIQKNMAVIFHKLGDTNSAVGALEQAIELAPHDYNISEAETGLRNLKN